MAGISASPAGFLPLRGVAVGCGLATVAAGLIVVTGWMLDVDVLKRLAPGFATMKVNTAVCLALVGVAVVAGDRGRRLTAVLLVVVSVIAAVSLAEYLMGWSGGIDEVLFRDLQPGTTYPGRMSVTTALALLVVVGGLCALRWRRPTVATTAAGIVFGAGWISLLGYLFGVEALYSVGPFSSVAAHTAASFVVLSVGLLVSVPDGVVPWIVRGTDSGAALQRRLLPIGLLGLPLLAELRLRGQQQGWYGTEFGLAMMVVVTSGVLASVTVQSARGIARADRSRRRVGSVRDPEHRAGGTRRAADHRAAVE